MALNDFDGTVMLGQPRPAPAARRVRGLLAGWARAGPRRSTAIWTTTSATCWTNPTACARQPRLPMPPPCCQRTPTAPTAPPTDRPGRRKTPPGRRRARQAVGERTKPLKKELEKVDKSMAADRPKKARPCKKPGHPHPPWQRSPMSGQTPESRERRARHAGGSVGWS